MNPFSAILGRLLTATIAILPSLAGMDLCTVGALTGRADLMCGMERAGAVCHAEAAPPVCPYCASEAPSPASSPAPGPAANGPTCCDLRPQATGTGETPAPGPPSPVSHPAVPTVPVADLPAVTAEVRLAADTDRAPPGEFPPPLSPRAPPLG